MQQNLLVKGSVLCLRLHLTLIFRSGCVSKVMHGHLVAMAVFSHACEGLPNIDFIGCVLTMTHWCIIVIERHFGAAPVKESVTYNLIYSLEVSRKGLSWNWVTRERAMTVWGTVRPFGVSILNNVIFQLGNTGCFPWIPQDSIAVVQVTKKTADTYSGGLSPASFPVQKGKAPVRAVCAHGVLFLRMDHSNCLCNWKTKGVSKHCPCRHDCSATTIFLKCPPWTRTRDRLGWSILVLRVCLEPGPGAGWAGASLCLCLPWTLTRSRLGWTSCALGSFFSLCTHPQKSLDQNEPLSNDPTQPKVLKELSKYTSPSFFLLLLLHTGLQSEHRDAGKAASSQTSQG